MNGNGEAYSSHVTDIQQRITQTQAVYVLLHLPQYPDQNSLSLSSWDNTAICRLSDCIIVHNEMALWKWKNFFVSIMSLSLLNEVGIVAFQ